MYAPPVQRLITELGKLPGIGQRTAQRLAFHILRADAEDANALADAIREVTIDPEAVDPEDVEMLQDMILAATNEALRSAQERAASKMGAATGGLGGPGGGLGGLGLPGL